ncbi:hypothetical protein Tco_0076819, partial [Tanacetum coccineum]
MQAEELARLQGQAYEANSAAKDTWKTADTVPAGSGVPATRRISLKDLSRTETYTLVGDNPTLGRSSSRHSTLGADQIIHQFLGADNGSSPLVYSIPGPVDRVPVLLAQHQVLNGSDNSLGGLVGYPASPREIPQESLELLVLL